MTRRSPHIVHIETPAASAAYDVVIGEGLIDVLHEHLPAAARYIIISDATVARLHAKRALDVLRRAGMMADLLSFPAGEEHKTRAAWSHITDRMLELGVGRDGCVLALGGGVTGDLAGFVAATYMRGLPLVQLPTTLLSMIDAAIGGKTGVDTAAGKNLIGAFHQPQLVLADLAMLLTLPGEHLRAGLAEAIKHGAVLDADYLEWIERSAPRLLALDPDATARLVSRSVELKAAVVAADPLERDSRAVLNFGHTVGHALELVTAYTLLHGAAVGIGMHAEAVAGERTGITERGTARRIAALLERCELPRTIGGVAPDDVLAAMRLDKKSRRATPRLVQLAEPGRCAVGEDGKWTHAVPEDVLRAAVREVIHDGGDV